MFAAGCRFIFVLFIGVVSAHAGPLEVLSKGASLATGNRCQSYDEKSAKMGVISVCLKDENSLASLKDIHNFLSEDAEDQFFARLAKQQVEELRCAEDYANSLNAEGSKQIPNIQAKLEVARLAKQKLAQASQELATAPDVTSRICPLDIASLEAEIPKELRGQKTFLLCKEIIVSRQSFQATVSTIPLSGVSDIQSFIDKVTSSQAEVSEKQIKEVYGKAAITIKNGASNLKNGLKEKGAQGLNRTDRHALLQDPALAEQVINQMPPANREDVRGLLCQADARYGKGSDALNSGVMVVSLAFSGGVGIWARTASVGKAAFLAEQGRKAGVVSLASMRTLTALQAGAFGVDALAAVIAVDDACSEKMVPELKTTGACTSAPSVEKMDHENCILMSALSTMGFAAVVPDKIWKALGTKVSDRITIATSGIKSVSKEQDSQSLIWAAKAEGNVAKAESLEKKLTESLKQGKIVDARPIGNGASRPYYVRFEDGTEGVWKKNTGWPANGSAEIAAYKLDKELGTDFVGTTVERSLDGVPGTVQVRVTNLKKKPSDDNPDELSLYDYLIGNRDRHYNNYLQNQDGRFVAIDHGLAFSTFDTTNGLLIFDNKVKALKTRIDKRIGLEKELAEVKSAPNSEAAAEVLKKEISKLKLQESKLQSAVAIAVPEKKVIDKLRQMKLADWKKVLGEDLSDKQLKALYKRQRELLRSIDKAVEDVGPQILYREGSLSPIVPQKPKSSGYPFGGVRMLLPFNQ